jgi:capsular exopolysaccharide synthesis family protein
VLKVLDRLELTEPPGELEEHVIAQTASDSLFLTITAQNADPATAAEIANAFADELVLASPDVLLTPDQPGGANLLQVVDPAVAPTGSVSPRTLMNTLLAGVLTLIAALGIVFLLEYRDDRIKAVGELADLAPGVPVLAVIPRSKEGEQGSGVPTIVAQPRSDLATAYRNLRTRLGFADPGTGLRTLLVTGREAGNDSAGIATNLAIAFAQAGSRVTLVDADLAEPRLHRSFGLSNDTGLTTQEPDAPSVDALSRQTPEPRLRMITAGPGPADPDQVLDPTFVGQLLRTSRETYDIMIIHAPGLDARGSAAVIAAIADGTLYIVDAPDTTQRDLAAARDTARLSGADVIGLVFVPVARSTSSPTERLRAIVDPSVGYRETP